MNRGADSKTMMTEKKYKWYKVADSVLELNFEANNILEVETAGRRICLVRTAEGIAACGSKCPHAGGHLSDGFLDSQEAIVCPIHRYRFDLKTGRDLTGEGYYLKIYPVRQDETGIFVGIPEGGLLGWLK